MCLRLKSENLYASVMVESSLGFRNIMLRFKAERVEDLYF